MRPPVHRILIVAAALLLSLGGTPATSPATSPASPTPPPPPPAPGTTVVSLTFDDGQATHFEAAALMQDRGMVGTFYISSSLVGSGPYYMQWWQLDKIARAGNEIGGHTRDHVNLENLDAAAVRAEVCDDRAALIAEGFTVTSFAYPESGVSPTAQQILRECGYTSGRAVGRIHNPDCPACPFAETLPPADPTYVRTVDGITSRTTLKDLQDAVTNAQTHGGGWVVYAFHAICDESCTGPNTVSTALFTGFLDWLAARTSEGVVVRTVGQAMTIGAAPPPGDATVPPCAPGVSGCPGGRAGRRRRGSVLR